MGDLEKGDIVFLALTGSPPRANKLARLESTVGSVLTLPPHVGMMQTPPHVGMTETPPHVGVAETPPQVGAMKVTTPDDVQRALLTPGTMVPLPSALDSDVGPSPMPLAAHSPIQHRPDISFPPVNTPSSTAAPEPIVPAESGLHYAERVLSLGIGGNTICCEVAAAFSWSIAMQPPSHEVLQGSFHDATIERARAEEWRVRCTRNTFINRTITNSASGPTAVVQISELFGMGWFRAPTVSHTTPHIPTPSYPNHRYPFQSSLFLLSPLRENCCSHCSHRAFPSPTNITLGTHGVDLKRFRLTGSRVWVCCKCAAG